MAGDTPKRIGRYEVERVLGVGAMGAVYLARDPQLGRRVAVKTVRNLDLDPPTVARYIERFKNEARAAGRLQHPSIVQVYDVGEDPDAGPFLVFEYVPGTTLRELVRAKGALSPKRLEAFVTEIGEALDLAHAQGIIHRDIKPDNLLVGEDGRFKLADFGIARVPDAALTKDGQFLGTPCYAAPETLRSGTYSPRSDEFSFAAVVYEVVTGMRAFPGDDAVAVAHKVAHEEPARPSMVVKDVVIPPAVDRVVMRGLSKDPEARYGSVGALAGALLEALGASNLRGPMPKRGASSRGMSFTVLVIGGLAFGVASVWLLGLKGAEAVDVDAGAVLDAGPTHRPAAPPKRGDAAARVPDASPADAAVPALPDAGTTETKTSHDREEAAKDALTRAQQWIERHEWERARAELDAAEELDRANTDVARLRALLPTDASGTAP